MRVMKREKGKRRSWEGVGDTEDAADDDDADDDDADDDDDDDDADADDDDEEAEEPTGAAVGEDETDC